MQMWVRESLVSRVVKRKGLFASRKNASLDKLLLLLQLCVARGYLVMTSGILC